MTACALPLVRIRFLPFFEVDIRPLVPLIFFDLAVPGLISLLVVRPVRFLARVIKWSFARIFLVRQLACTHVELPLLPSLLVAAATVQFTVRERTTA